ncbi:hypothetical protein QE433_001891, partial [Agrobacterium tumefaciens]|nr:hypothetical protein [Agrobacterium tumefaciens]
MFSLERGDASLRRDDISILQRSRGLHAFYDVADTLADDVLVGDLSCLNVEN